MTRTDKLILRFGEGLATIAIAAFACTLAPVGTFCVGLGYAVVLMELARWEKAQA